MCKRGNSYEFTSNEFFWQSDALDDHCCAGLGDQQTAKKGIWPALDIYGDLSHADEIEILQLKGPQAVVVQDYSDGYDMSLEFRIPGEDSLTYLSVTWVRENDTWKINGYGLEK